MPHTVANHFLESLVTLTQERDSLGLECCMKETLSSLLKLLNLKVLSIEVYRIKDISTLFFSALSAKQDGDDHHDFCQSLMDSYNTSSLQQCQLDNQQLAYLFPLRNQVAHLNAVVAVTIEGAIASQSVVEAIGQLLDVYQNYTNLINDNERDTLTGLLNRKTFDKQINKIMTQLTQSSLRLNDRSVDAHYLAIFDIDHFKKVNDVHGHLIGDEVLLLFSQLMTKTFRETDPLFRFGGEEFVGLFSCAKLNDVEVLLERFRDKLANYAFPQVGRVTVSIGCTRIADKFSPDEYIDKADAALYYAKQHGRNHSFCTYITMCYQHSFIN